MILMICKMYENSVSALAPTGTRSTGHFTVSAIVILFNFQGAGRTFSLLSLLEPHIKKDPQREGLKNA